MQAGNKTNQSKVMISVKVRDEDVLYALKFDFILSQLNLCALTTVHEE
jgi:hypothetical protein